MRILAIVILLSGIVFSNGAGAVNPDEVLSDPALEARARVISKDVRCVVCQNQSIDDSDAELARDLRVLVRERITAGDSNQQVLDYLVSRYGDFILLNPPFKSSTLFLWLGPILFIVLGLIAVIVFLRRQTGANEGGVIRTIPLSEDEKRRLDKLLEDEAS